MALSQDIIQQAAAILRNNGVSLASGLKEIGDVLEDFVDRRGIDDEDFTELCERAKAALSTIPRQQQQPPPDLTPRGGNRQGAPANSGNRRAADAQNFRAPFRFVQVNADVTLAKAKAAKTGINNPLSGGFCGRILVDWAVETPLMIGERGEDNIEGPLRLGNTPAIPGATLRGLMRSAAENIGRGRLFQVNRHHRYGVREFDHYLFATEREEVRGGWLRCEILSEDALAAGRSPRYFVQPCKIASIRIRDLPLRKGTDPGRFHLDWLRKSLPHRYIDLGQANAVDANHVAYDFKAVQCFELLPNDQLIPRPNGDVKGVIICSDTSPAIGGKVIRRAKELASNDKNLKKYIEQAEKELARELNDQDASPNEEQYKKRETVFINSKKDETEISPLAFSNFELAYTVPSKNKRQATGTYKFLEPMFKAGQSIPIFYIGELSPTNEKLTFGLTRLFKRSHLNSVGDLLARNHPRHQLGGWQNFEPDLIENLFGYVFEKDELGLAEDGVTPPADIALKGRVAFGFAMLQKPERAQETTPITTIMSGPRASFGPFYLRGRTKDWSADDAKLAGRKIYFPRYPVTDAPSRNQARESVQTITKDRLFRRQTDGTILYGQPLGNDALHTRVKFLQPRDGADDLVFRGEIRLHNVSAVEIGLVLWTLMHGGDPRKPYRHMIGRAKSAGAGQTRVKALRLTLDGNDDAAKEIIDAAQPAPWESPSADGEGWLMEGSLSTAPFLRAFDQAMGAQWRADPTLLGFLGASRPSEGARLRNSHADEYLHLDLHKPLKAASKRMGPDSPEPSMGQPDAYLAAPALPVSELRRPYLT